MSAPGLLVDLDGTLAETADANFAAYAAALAEAGVAVDRAAFDAVAAGRNWRHFLPILLGPRAALAPDVAARKTALYAAHIAHVRINEGLRRLIAGWAGPAALVTTASRASVDAILAGHGLGPLFAATVTGDDVSRHKPDPEPFLTGAARLGLAPADCLAFEDSDAGVESARAAGVPVVRIAFEGG